MKKFIFPAVGALFIAALLSGCASPMPTGVIYTGIQSPIAATSNMPGTKVGKATSNSILSLFAYGDASIKTAARNGGITKISHVDYSAQNILGIYGTYTTTVYGR